MTIRCYQFRELVDSYIDHESSFKTNREVISHLEHCLNCREELAARSDLRVRLREALIKAQENQMRPEFASLLRAQLHSQALSKTNINPTILKHHPHSFHFQRPLLMTLVACLVLTATIGLVLLLVHHPNYRNTSAGPDPALMPNLIRTQLAKSAVGDHRDCAIHFRLAERPIDLEEAGRTYDRAYLSLVKTVTSSTMWSDLEFLEAHSCVFQERRFAHLVFKYHGRKVSFLVTDNERTESIQSTPSTGEHSHVIACSQFDGYGVSCFQTARHTVFVVSDLPEGENLTLARAFEPSVVEHLTISERSDS